MAVRSLPVERGKTARTKMQIAAMSPERAPMEGMADPITKAIDQSTIKDYLEVRSLLYAADGTYRRERGRARAIGRPGTSG